MQTAQRPDHACKMSLGFWWRVDDTCLSFTIAKAASDYGLSTKQEEEKEMITVEADRIQGSPYNLTKLKIRKENMEIMQDLGSYPCLSGDESFDGPICRVVMTSGRVLFINATSEELEARSA